MSDTIQTLSIKDWLGFSVIGTAITVLGSFVALYAKEFVATRSIERWKAQQAVTAIYDRYRRPIATISTELSGRCFRASEFYEDWRGRIGIEEIASMASLNSTNAMADNRYYRYTLLSDAYRLCCFFKWIELYRRELGLLNINRTKYGMLLEKQIQNIRSDLADGQRNFHPDWHEWRDSLIFREEQRAIAHRMINQSDKSSLIDFGTFCEILIQEIDEQQKPGWFIISVFFFMNLQQKKDFRRTRMRYLVVHLTAIRELLQPGTVPPEHIVGSKKLRRALDDEETAASSVNG